MGRGGGDRDRDRQKRGPKDRDNRRGAKKKICIFCKDHIEWVDYKDVNLLRRFMSDRGKIRARRVSGNCAQHQREVAVAIKTARELALLPYTQRTVMERAGGRMPRPSSSPMAEMPLPPGPADAETEIGLVDVDLGLDVDVEAEPEPAVEDEIGDELE